MRPFLALTLIIGCAGPTQNKPAQHQGAAAVVPVESKGPSPAAIVPQEAATASPVPPVKEARVCPELEPPLATTAKAMKAQQDFARAEKFFSEEFMPFRITTVLLTRKQATEVLGKLIHLSDEARTKYQELVKSGGPLSLAARVRYGDLFYFQAHKIATMPVPTQVISLATQYPSQSVLVDFDEALESQTQPLQEQASIHWQAAIDEAEKQCITNAWTALARVRLAQLANQDVSATAKGPPPACQKPSIYVGTTQSDFDHAETFYKKTFETYQVKLLPKTISEAHEFLEEINILGARSRQKYLNAARGRRGSLAVAATVRAGDVAYQQAKAILDIPAPKSIYDLDLPMPENKKLLAYEAGMARVAGVLEDIAFEHWKAADDAGQWLCVKGKWTNTAKKRLAQPRLVDPAMR